MTRCNRLEDAIQRAVFAHYNARRARDAVMFAVPNGGLRSRVEGAIMKGLGVAPGAALKPNPKPRTGFDIFS